MKTRFIAGLGLAGLVVAGTGVALAQVQAQRAPPATRAQIAQAQLAAPPRALMVTHLSMTVLGQSAGDKAAVIRLKATPATLALRQQVSANKLLAANVDLAAVDRVRTPVLIAPKTSLIANLRIFPSEDRFTASTSEPGVVIEVVGTRTPFVTPKAGLLLNKGLLLKPMIMMPMPPQLAPTPMPVRPPLKRVSLMRALLGAPAYAQPAPTPAGEISNIIAERTEYGIDVSFSRFGSIYNLTIACDAPETDPRCSEANAIATAQSLQILGGGAP